MVTGPQSGIRDNHRRGTLADFLRSKIREGSRLSIMSAYFTIYAFDALRDHLKSIDHLDFLFGEPRFVKSLDPDRTDKKAFKIEDEGLQLANRLEQKQAARECAEWVRQKVAIKSVRQANLLHGKMYHLAKDGVEDAILGSFNFTVRGLGLATSGNNIELNLEVDSNRDRRDLKAWFDELWNDAQLVEDVKQEVLLYLEQLYQNHSPEFIYYKTLFHIFEKFLGEQERGGLLDQAIKLIDTDIWKILFEFQKDGVKGAINKILKHNGCILADSVGLGKTYESLAVIKYFELRNERVLVLCPKKLRDNWTVYQAHNNSELNPFVKDRFAYTVLCHTDLSREAGKSGDIDLSALNWGNFGLIVIDESHNFRNNTKGRRDEDGNIVRTGVKSKVLLLSATPVNNDLKDLRNQIYFMTEGRDDAFQETIGMASLQETLRAAQLQFSQWAKKQTTHRRTNDLLERLSAAFFTLLDELTIARSRKHIQKYYKDAVAELGGFPERLKPVSVFPEIDLAKKFMSYDRLNQEIRNYQLSLFNPSKYLKPEFHRHYFQQAVFPFTQEEREFFLIAMMKINFLKRLESSVHSFAITMERTIQKITTLEDKIAAFKRRLELNGELTSDELRPEDEEDPDLQSAFDVGGKLKFQLAHLDIDRWLTDLDEDKKQLHLLYLAARDVTQERDAKLRILKDLIERCIYGVDIQPIAVQIAKLRCFISLVVDQRADPKADNLGIRPLPNLETQFVAANTLLDITIPPLRNIEIDPLEAELKRVRDRHFNARTLAAKRKCREEDAALRTRISALLESDGFQHDTAQQLAAWDPYDQNATAEFFDPEWMFGVQDGFDITIGNPPYVRQEDIKDQKAAFKDRYDCYTGTADLYVYFYERSVRLLKEGGVLSFISSNKYFRSGYGEKLRRFLGEDTRLLQVIDFGDAPVFTAIAYPCIVILAKAPPGQHQTRVLTWEPGPLIEEFPAIFTSKSFTLAQKELKKDGWRLESPVVLRLLDKLRKAGTPLGDYVKGRFYYGIKTGLNDAFVVDRATRDRLIAEDKSSKDVLKPFLRGRDVKRWRVEPQDLWLLFVPWHFPLHKDTSIQGPSKKAEKDFKEQYPAVYEHLLKFKKDLSARNAAETGVRYEWYALQRWGAEYWQEFEQPKILYQEIATYQAFAWDVSRSYTNNKTFLIPGGDKFLLALLNSKACWWFLDQIASKLQGGAYALQAPYVSQIPVPGLSSTSKSSILKLVDSILSTKAKDPAANVSALEAEIDALVYALYGLTKDEIKIVKESSSDAGRGTRTTQTP